VHHFAAKRKQSSRLRRLIFWSFTLKRDLNRRKATAACPTAGRQIKYLARHGLVCSFSISLL
jgi:hypothetical protein